MFTRPSKVNIQNQSAFPVRIKGYGKTDWDLIINAGEESGQMSGTHSGRDIEFIVFTKWGEKYIRLELWSFDNPLIGTPKARKGEVLGPQTFSSVFDDFIERDGYIDSDRIKGHETPSRYNFYGHDHNGDLAEELREEIKSEEILYEPVKEDKSSPNPKDRFDEPMFELVNYLSKGVPNEWDLIINYPSTTLGMPDIYKDYARRGVEFDDYTKFSDKYSVWDVDYDAASDEIIVEGNSYSRATLMSDLFDKQEAYGNYPCWIFNQNFNEGKTSPWNSSNITSSCN